MADKIGRNDPCTCGSGKKYKQCCLKNNKPGKRRFKATVLSAKTIKASTPETEDEGPDLIARIHPGLVIPEQSIQTAPSEEEVKPVVQE